MTKLDHFWMTNDEWIRYENRRFVLREDAPAEARESYNRYIEQRRGIDARTDRRLTAFKSEEGWHLFDECRIDWMREHKQTGTIMTGIFMN